MFTTIISSEEVAAMLGQDHLLIFDTRFYLADPEQGRREYAASRIPGAIYAHLDEDLSGEIIPGTTGRHPMPDPQTWVQRLGGWGLTPAKQVVVYDQGHGGIASRMWQMIRMTGHEAVAVLNGGWKTWQGEGRPMDAIPPEVVPNRSLILPETGSKALLVSAEDLLDQPLLLDARARVRYRGEQEPIDPVAGHIPGAISAPFTENLDEQGQFLSAEKLRQRFEGLLQGNDPSKVVCYCGSGVTACHNLLALEIAGLPGARLYPGSWSEWITDPRRPVAITID